MQKFVIHLCVCVFVHCIGKFLFEDYRFYRQTRHMYRRVYGEARVRFIRVTLYSFGRMQIGLKTVPQKFDFDLQNQIFITPQTNYISKLYHTFYRLYLQNAVVSTRCKMNNSVYNLIAYRRTLVS
jgi:hypothetical protein